MDKADTYTFAEQQKEVWKMYDELLKKAPKDIQVCKQLRDMYPVIAGHYAFLSRHGGSTSHCQKLERYLQISRNILDVRVKEGKQGFFKKLFRFYSAVLPDRIYLSRRYIFSSGFFLWLGIIFSFVLVINEPELGSAFLGSSEYYHYRSQIESGIKFQNFFLPENFEFVTIIGVLMNNLKVALLTMFSGLLLGVGTVYILTKNAFIVGALSGLYYRSEHFPDFITQIFQHGFLELTAIIFSGASGLLIASPFFYSGYIKRKDLLRKRIKQAGELFLGSISLLLIAALIEGIVTPLHLPLYQRCLVIISTIILLGAYLSYSLSHAKRKAI